MNNQPGSAQSSLSYEELLEKSAAVQKKSDIYLIIGGGFIGTTVFGLIGLPFFIYGLWLIKKSGE